MYTILVWLSPFQELCPIMEMSAAGSSLLTSCSGISHVCTVCHCDKAACKMLNVWQPYNALSTAKVGHIVKHGIFCCSCSAVHQLLISGCCDVVKVI